MLQRLTQRSFSNTLRKIKKKEEVPIVTDTDVSRVVSRLTAARASKFRERGQHESSQPRRRSTVQRVVGCLRNKIRGVRYQRQRRVKAVGSQRRFTRVAGAALRGAAASTLSSGETLRILRDDRKNPTDGH